MSFSERSFSAFFLCPICTERMTRARLIGTAYVRILAVEGQKGEIEIKRDGAFVGKTERKNEREREILCVCVYVCMCEWV